MLTILVLILLGTNYSITLYKLFPHKNLKSVFNNYMITAVKRHAEMFSLCTDFYVEM